MSSNRNPYLVGTIEYHGDRKMQKGRMKVGLAVIMALLLAFPISLVKPGAESTSEVIVILVSDNPADLAIAISLAVSINATVVVTPWGMFNETAAINVVGELPDKVIIIGGPVAVPETYAQIFQDLGISVERIGGSDRYETNELILDWMLSNNVEIKPDKVVLIHGLDLAALEQALDLVVEGEFLVLLVKDENVTEVAELVEKIAPSKVEVIESPMINITSVQLFLQGNISIAVEVTVSHTLAISIRERARKAIEEANEKLSEATQLANDLTLVDVEISHSIETATSLLNQAIEHFNNGEFELALELSLDVLHLSNKIVHKVNLVISTGQADLASSLEFKLELYIEMLHIIQTKGVNITRSINITKEIEICIKRKEYDKAQQFMSQLEEAIKECMLERKRSGPPEVHGTHEASPHIPSPGASPWRPSGG